MPAQPVIAVFDIGKTNKKTLLFDARYRATEQHTTHLRETLDDTGQNCENITSLTHWVKKKLEWS